MYEFAGEGVFEKAGHSVGDFDGGVSEIRTYVVSELPCA